MTEDEETAEADRDLEILNSHIAQLSEHFSTVNVIVTKDPGEDGQTTCYGRGSGNYYARVGSTREWLRNHG